jgi:hypothetical protein
MSDDLIKSLYMKARCISRMRDGFMEPWEFEYAKLIVQECRKVITDFDGVEDFEYMLNPRSVRWDCDCEIRDHFGLEE